MASAPALLLGAPTFDPGSLDMTAPDPPPLPPPVGGASTEPESIDPPKPEPLAPLPEPKAAVPPPTPGGGGITFPARSVPPGDPCVLPEPRPEPETDGGGGTTFVPAPGWPPAMEAERPEPEMEGGGGTTLVPGAVLDPPRKPLGLPEELATLTFGGGGTTSCVPKTFPISVLNRPVCDGGGGTTVLEGSG
jgi:hypothetical protein